MSRKWAVILVLVLLVVVVFATPLRSGLYAYATANKMVVTLDNFEVKSSGGNVPNCTQKYLVYTTPIDARPGSGPLVFENTDSSWRFKWNSSDVQASLMKLKGQKVVLFYYGWRFPYWSWYPNIYKFESLTDESLTGQTPK